MLRFASFFFCHDGWNNNASSRRLAEAARASEVAEEDVLRRKDLEMEVERLNGELQQVWEILRSRVMLHYAEDLRTRKVERRS